ncbi:hypothetical protein F2Q69_00040355 [Brassica cretica]|uniref:Uncharacterized protein n=1 Tax=Brassica cretica TaxID=69181 RepID=A0A8S9NI21_BRACR|nr:hypothetical protein F2Q69_00040355 [Brassica cretica]
MDENKVEAIYELWGVDYAVEIKLPDDDETPETALAELGIAFAQMAPNFFRYFLSSWVRAREEGLEFGLGELKQLFAIKQNSGFPGTMILAPRPGHFIIDGIPNRDHRWREKFFVFKINPASVEPFGPAPMTPELRGLITTLLRGNPRWLAITVDRTQAANALPLGENHATPIGLAAPIRPGKGRRNKRAREKEPLPDHPNESYEVGSLERAQKARRGPILKLGSQAQSPGLMAWPVSIAAPVGGARRTPNTSADSVGGRALNDAVDSSTHRRRRQALEEINCVSSNSPSSGLPPPLRASGEGTSQVDPSAHLPDVHETSSWRFLYDNNVPILENPERLALIWHKIREKGCELPSFGDMQEHDAYVRMAIANDKAMEASNEYAALMERRLADFPSKKEVGSHLLTIQQLRGELEAVQVTEQQREVEIEGLKGKLAAAETEKVAVQNDLDLMKEKHRREIEGCDAAGRKECNLARLSLAREYDAVLAVEVRARIEALTECIEGGFELEEELERLKDQEISLDVDYGLASVSDPSLSRLELPEVSGDSIDQD